MLNVFVETVGGDVVGAGLRINASLRTRFKALSANYTALKESSEVLRRLVETLEAENENLRTQARDLSYAVNTLQKQVWGLMENNTKQNQRIAELDGSIEGLRLEKTVLLTLLIVALAVPPAILTVKKLRVGK